MLICPICDSTLTNRFCPVCRKFVKDPWVLDDHVYINRSHSLPDDFCEFHGNGRKVTYLNRTADKKSPLISMPCPNHRPIPPGLWQTACLKRQGFPAFPAERMLSMPLSQSPGRTMYHEKSKKIFAPLKGQMIPLIHNEYRARERAISRFYRSTQKGLRTCLLLFF